MAASIPRPKRNSTSKNNPEPKPVLAESLYGDKDDSGDILTMQVADLCPNPFNRRGMHGIPELAATIAEVGLLQDIAHIRAEVWVSAYPETADLITAPNVILFGEHRWRAVQHLGWTTISSILRDDKVDQARLITLIENLRRSQLTPLEEAEHYRALREEGLTYEQIADRVGETADGSLSKGTVWKRVKLLDLVPEAIEALREGVLKPSAAEKFLKMQDREQRAAMDLVRDGVHPVEAHAQILARPKAPEDVSTGNAESAASGAGSVGENRGPKAPEDVSTGNAEEAEPNGQENTERVSTGNVPAQQRAKKSGPTADRYEQDRRSAAAARDAACQQLLTDVDPLAPAGIALVLQVVTSALLTPQQQQSAAQQRALTWLRRVGRHEVEEENAPAYFTAVQESSHKLQRLAALAIGLASCEQRTASRRQSWGSRELAYVRLLQEHAQYEPETEWEQNELGLTTTGDTR